LFIFLFLAKTIWHYWQKERKQKALQEYIVTPHNELGYFLTFQSLPLLVLKRPLGKNVAILLQAQRRLVTQPTVSKHCRELNTLILTMDKITHSPHPSLIHRLTSK